MLFQMAALFDSMTVGENVGLALREHTTMKSEEIRQVVAEKLALVGLRGIEDKKPSDLSGGMRKRVGLARAIAMDPDLRPLRRAHDRARPDHGGADQRPDRRAAGEAQDHLHRGDPRHAERLLRWGSSLPSARGEDPLRRDPGGHALHRGPDRPAVRLGRPRR